MSFKKYCIRIAKKLGGRDLISGIRRDAMVAYGSVVSVNDFIKRNYAPQVQIDTDGNVSYQEKP